MPYVRESFARGESFPDISQAQERGEYWCLHSAGQRIHGTTRRRPIEVFEAEAKSALLPPPETPYDMPSFADVRVQRDQHIAVCKALYSVPERYVGEEVHVRADSALVRIYHRRRLIKTHARAPVGGRQTDDRDFPEDKQIYARRDTAALQAKADRVGPATSRYAAHILDGPAPWQRMRAVYRLLGLVRRFGAAPVEDACQRALDLDVVDVTRIERIVKQALEKSPTPAPKSATPHADNVIPLRFS